VHQQGTPVGEREREVLTGGGGEERNGGGGLGEAEAVSWRRGSPIGKDLLLIWLGRWKGTSAPHDETRPIWPDMWWWRMPPFGARCALLPLSKKKVSF